MIFSAKKGLWLAVFFSAVTGAQTKAPTKEGKKKDQGPAVIDFEADLIQGEAQRPDLMTQFGDKPMEIDSLLYLRRDFNDLQQSDASRRPSFFPAPKVLGGSQ